MRRLAVAGMALFALACHDGAATPGRPLPPEPTVAPPATHPPALGVAPDRSKLPTPGAPPAWALAKPEQWTLGNGLRVYFLKQGPTPLVNVTLMLPRGSATDPKGKAGLTALTADLLDEGIAGKDALALSEELQRLGTSYSASTDVDSVMLSMTLLAENLDPSVKLLAEIIRRPTMSDKEFARRKDQRIADALASESEPLTARAIVMRRALFGEGYAGNASTGTRSTLKRLSLGDVKTHYQGLVQPDGAALIAVGGIDAAPVKQALESAFGDWKGSSKVKSAPVVGTPLAPGIHFVDYPNTTQSALAVVRRAPPEGTAEYFPALVVSRLLGESFSSRLNLNLREAKGYTYGASSSFRRWKEAGHFGLYANVKRETTRASIDETLREIRDLCGTRPIQPKEREEAVGGLLLGFPGRFERVGDVSNQLALLPLYNRPDDWFEKWPERVKSVSLENARDFVKGYCKREDYVVIVAGDRKIVEPTLEGLELKLQFYDPQGNRLKK